LTCLPADIQLLPWILQTWNPDIQQNAIEATACKKMILWHAPFPFFLLRPEGRMYSPLQLRANGSTFYLTGKSKTIPAHSITLQFGGFVTNCMTEDHDMSAR
jgi:hypothetical protein